MNPATRRGLFLLVLGKIGVKSGFVEKKGSDTLSFRYSFHFPLAESFVGSPARSGPLTRVVGQVSALAV